MKRTIAGGLGVLTFALGGLAFAQETKKTDAVVHQTFATDTEGWVAFGSNAKVEATQEKEQVKQSKGSLRFAYGVTKDQLNALLLPTADGKIATAKTVKFWVKTDRTTPLALSFTEKDGGRYSALFTAPGDQWQQVELALADFQLNTGPGDPKDPNGKLDMDKVENIMLLDVNQFFVQNPDANLSKLFNVAPGDHTLYLNDFLLGTEPLPAPAKDKDGTVLDDFSRPQLNWIGVGDVKISQGKGFPLDTAALKATYHQKPDTFVGILRRVAGSLLKGKEQMTLTATSSKPTRLIVQVEEEGGGKYNTMLQLPGKEAKKEYAIPFSDFKASDDSHDTNDHLDLDKVNQILFIDVSGPFDKADTDNTLWIGPIHVGAR